MSGGAGSDCPSSSTNNLCSKIERTSNASDLTRIRHARRPRGYVSPLLISILFLKLFFINFLSKYFLKYFLRQNNQSRISGWMDVSFSFCFFASFSLSLFSHFN